MATSQSAVTANNSKPPISEFSQKKVVVYCQNVLRMLKDNASFRSKLLEQDKMYARETDTSTAQARAKNSNLAGDPTKIQNVVVPVVGPQVDSAKAYLVDMFLSSYPIFPVTAPPKNADVAVQLETLLGHSAVYFQWARHFALCFQDGLKHNIQAAEVDWKRETVTSIINSAADNIATGTPTEELFSGNMIKRIDPYNLIFDRRVPPAENHKRGEFVGYAELITRIELKQLLLDLDRSLTMNATDAFQTPTGSAKAGTDGGVMSYYIPQVNPESLAGLSSQDFNWLSWLGADTRSKIKYQDMYEVITLYCRIIPKEFGIFVKTTKNPGDPQIYKFLIVNQKVVIFAQRMTNAHNMLPIIIGQMNEDGLGLQTKSYADNAAPYQSIATALWTSGIHSQRRKVYDRILYDPSRINKADIDRTDPVARIPVKEAAYGTPMSEAIYVTPYRDEGVAAILGMAREVVDMADIATGSNRVQKGQFQKGNKTRTEFSEVMSNSDARPRTTAILLGVSWFQPIKDILKMNILQYQPPAELFNPAQKQAGMVKIDPVQLRTVAWQFQLADGIMPSDKFLNFELFGQTLQFAMGVPQAAAEWDMLGMYAYQLKMQGARWVDDFRRTPEQQQQYLQQQMALNAPPPGAQLPAPPGAAQ